MDSILNVVGSGQYLRYRGSNVMNAADQVNLPNGLSNEGLPVNMDELEIYTPTPLEIRQSWWPYFHTHQMRISEATSDVARDVETHIDNAIGSFLDGNMSDQELSDIFTTQLTRMCDTCKERGYPIPGAGGADGEQAIADCFYDDFRLKLLNEAIRRNDEEGLQYASNGKNGNWLYYNSDYYHKTEAALAATKSSVMSYCHEKGYTDFSLIPSIDQWQLKVDGYNYYEDFNSAWEHHFCNEQTFLDKEQAPPKDFTWFYETGGTFAPGYVALIPDQAPKGPGFDPESFLSARMWATYKDADGNLHAGGTVFSYSFEKVPTNLKNVSALLSFMGGDDALSRYLQNLQVFRLGHFDKPHTSSVDVRA